MVIVYVPVGVVEDVAMVIVLVNVGLPDDRLKLADAPEGKPEAERLTVWVGPLTNETVTVADILLPCWTLPLLGVADTEKSNGSCT
jgi:hypothetical protein